jgi:hypothetical protein
MENLVQELRQELRNKRPMTANGYDGGGGSGSGAAWEDEKIEMEVRLQKAQARIDAMQNEMTSGTTLYAKEIAKLKLLVSVSNIFQGLKQGDIGERIIDRDHVRRHLQQVTFRLF